MTKLPPVVVESVTATLEAFTCRLSATEPEVIVNVVEGELRETFAFALYVSVAARTIDGKTMALPNTASVRR